jgi:hypothetical protein
MTRCINSLNLDISDFQYLLILRLKIRHKRLILVLTVERRQQTYQGRSCGMANSQCARGMITMRMGHQHTVQYIISQHGQNSLPVRWHIRARIQQYPSCAANQVSIGSRPGHHAGVWTQYPDNRNAPGWHPKDLQHLRFHISHAVSLWVLTKTGIRLKLSLMLALNISHIDFLAGFSVHFAL